MFGKGDGTFQAEAPFEATYYPRTYTIGDLNGDGIVDLAQFSTSDPTGAPPQTATVWLSTPALSFTVSALQFSSQNIGTSSSPKTILLSNAGNAPLSLTGIAASGDFSQTNTCANTLAIKEGCSAQVTFTPTANGPRSGLLTFTDNAKPGTQKTLSLGLGRASGLPDLGFTNIRYPEGRFVSFILACPDVRRRLRGHGGGVLLGCAFGGQLHAFASVCAAPRQQHREGSSQRYHNGLIVCVSPTAFSCPNTLAARHTICHSSVLPCHPFRLRLAGTKVEAPRHQASSGRCILSRFGRMRWWGDSRYRTTASHRYAVRQLHAHADHDERKHHSYHDTDFSSPVRANGRSRQGVLFAVCVTWRFPLTTTEPGSPGGSSAIRTLAGKRRFGRFCVILTSLERLSVPETKDRAERTGCPKNPLSDVFGLGGVAVERPLRRS